MPLYEYECDACHKRFERIQKYADAPIDVCPNCGQGPVRKLLSSPAIQFKGTGWYVTDYAKKSSTDASSKTTGTNDRNSGGDKPASTPSTGDSPTKKDS